MERERIQKKKIQRSPGYPIISLKEAIRRAKILWDKDGNNTIRVETVYEHLGYASTGGYASRIYAALKKFGLIVQKDNDVKLSQEAIDLAIYAPSDSNYIEAIKNIALKPDIYKKIYTEYDGELPSDANIKAKLIKEHKFNPAKVNDFINNFRGTIEFAGLTGIEGIKEKEDMQDNGSDVTISADPIKATMKVSGTPVIDNPTFAAKHYPIPLSKGKTAIIAFEELPIEKEDVENIKKWLDLFSGTLTEVE